MDPVLSRQLFQGKASPQQSAGKGIVGLVEEDAPARAMTAVAGSVDKFEQGVDGAQDYEQLMNAVRGNQKPLEERYAELAKVVGEDDARATPESVLAVAQPALELLSGKGIEALTGVVSMGTQPPVQGFAEGGPVSIPPQTGYDADYAAYAQRLDRILGKPASLEAEVAKRQALFAENDTSSFDANLALMKYGSQVANTPGGILPALTKPAGDLATDLSKVANKRADLNRGIKASALEYADSDKKMRMGAHVGALKDSFNSFQEDRRLAMKLNADRLGSENAMKAVTVILEDGSEQPAIQKGTMFINPTTQIPVTGIKSIKDDANGGKVSAQSFMIKDNAAPGGVRSVLGYMTPNGQIGYRENGVEKSVDSAEVLPGSYNDFFDVKSNVDERGGSLVTVKQGPQAGRTFRMDNTGKMYSEDGKEVKSSGMQPVRDGLNPDVAQAAQQYNAAMQKHTPAAQRSLSKGAFDVNGPEASFLSVGPSSYTSGTQNMTPKEQDEARKDIAQYENLLRVTDDVLKAVPEATGIWPSTKSLVGNVTGSFGWKKYVDPKNEAQRTALATYSKALQQAVALNPRFAVSEQDFIRNLGGDPEAFFRDPELVMAKVRELARQSMNDMEVKRAALEGRDPLVLDYIPQGTEKDPLTVSDPRHKDYLARRYQRGDDLRGLVIVGTDGKPQVWSKAPLGKE